MVGRVLAWLLLFAIVIIFFAFLGVALYAGLIIFMIFLLYGAFLTIKNEVMRWWHKRHKKEPEITVEWYEADAKEVKDKKIKAIDMGEIVIIEKEEK